MKRVMVFGTFDLLHAGHRDFFRQAALLGRVTAVVARDASVLRIKGKLPLHNERSRLARVARDPSVSAARLGHPSDFLLPIAAAQPDIIALGFNQRTFTIPQLRSLLAARRLTPRITRLTAHHPDTYSTSRLRSLLVENTSNPTLRG